jgi:hypothetical protein
MHALLGGRVMVIERQVSAQAADQVRVPEWLEMVDYCRFVLGRRRHSDPRAAAAVFVRSGHSQFDLLAARWLQTIV